MDSHHAKPSFKKSCQDWLHLSSFASWHLFFRPFLRSMTRTHSGPALQVNTFLLWDLLFGSTKAKRVNQQNDKSITSTYQYIHTCTYTIAYWGRWISKPLIKMQMLHIDSYSMRGRCSEPASGSLVLRLVWLRFTILRFPYERDVLRWWIWDSYTPSLPS